MTRGSSLSSSLSRLPVVIGTALYFAVIRCQPTFAENRGLAQERPFSRYRWAGSRTGPSGQCRGGRGGRLSARGLPSPEPCPNQRPLLPDHSAVLPNSGGVGKTLLAPNSLLTRVLRP